MRTLVAFVAVLAIGCADAGSPLAPGKARTETDAQTQSGGFRSPSGGGTPVGQAHNIVPLVVYPYFVEWHVGETFTAYTVEGYTDETQFVVDHIYNDTPDQHEFTYPVMPMARMDRPGYWHLVAWNPGGQADVWGVAY